MENRDWVQVYELATDESGFEHVNPNLIMAAHIEQSEEDGVVVIVTNTENNQRIFEFYDVKEAQRFIKRLGNLA